MRKFLTLGLLSTVLLAGAAPLQGQRANAPAVKRVPGPDSSFDTVRPVTDGAGVLVRWQMRTESGIAGYNVYRVEGDVKAKVNRHIVLASTPRVENPMAYGEARQFFDAEGRAGADYVVEAVRFDGTRSYASPATARFVGSLEAETGTSSAAFLEAAAADGSFQYHRADLSAALTDLVSTYAQEPDPDAQFAVASKPGVKIAVRTDGFYRVTAAEMAAAGFPAGSDPANWRLFVNGAEQAIIVGANGSYVEFYGRGVDLPETDTRIYYLIADTVAGKRIGTRVLRTVPGSAPARNFPVVFETKERKTYSETYFNYDEENFLGQGFDSTGHRVRFNLSGVDFAEPTAKITITLYGWGSNTHHRVTSTINGHELPVMTQFGSVHYRETFTIPTEHLAEGENELEMFSGTNDWNIFNKVEVAYKRKFTASSGRVSFSSPGARKIDLDGFETSAVRVFDTTFEGNPVLLGGVQVEEASVGYHVRVPATRMMVGYAVEDTGLMQSPAVTPISPSTLANPANAADMVIISHSAPDFLAAAEDWAAYRRSAAGGGLTTKVVDIEDVFDEFDFGLRTSAAVKNFLNHASANWATKPKYVLLLGDSSTDPRQYTSASRRDLIPSRTVMLIETETSSDEALGDFDNDNLSTLAIGRIPARTAAQAVTAFNKMLAFEATQLSFARGALFVHDAALDVNSAGYTEQMIQRLPQGAPVTRASAAEAGATANLVAKFNQGNFLVNYFGHGSSGVWGNSGFFQIDTVNLLTNRDNPSFVPMFSCLNGHFALHERDSLAETLLFSPTGGAAAVWASTGKTTADLQAVMADRFFEELVGTNLTRAGDMIKSAKAAVPSGRDVKLSWALLGDPAMKMP